MATADENYCANRPLRGATVETVECYQRTPISYNNEEQTSICIRSGVQPCGNKPEILQALIEFVPENEQNWLKIAV